MLSCLPVAPGWAQAGDTTSSVTIPLDRAHAVALAALKKGDTGFAAQISQGLLARDPEDAYAHLLLAEALVQSGAANAARRQAGQAFRFARTPAQKFQSAQIAAKLSYRAGQLTRSQLWLRRSLPHAPSDAHRAVVVKDFQRVRAENPLNLQFSSSVAPSSNVNNGADSGLATIDGIPVIGILSGDAQALSGIVATTDTRLKYRVQGSAVSRTDISLLLATRHVWLSGEAKALAPTAQNSDYTTYTVETGVAHLRRLGPGTLVVGADLGRSWQGGTPRQDIGRLRLSYGLDVAAKTAIMAQVDQEWRRNLANRSGDQQLLSLTTRLSHQLANGGRLGFGIAWRQADSVAANGRSDRWLAYASYEPGGRIGPMRMGMTIGAAREVFGDYGVGLFPVPGGRRDESVFANLELRFDGFDYAGFSPAVTFRAQKTQSNVSRFDTTEFAISAGIRSSF